MTKINLSTKLLQLKISDSNKIMIGLLIELTKQREFTTVSNAYLGSVMGGKTEQQVSRILRSLKRRKIITTSRDMGRRQINVTIDNIDKSL